MASSERGKAAYAKGDFAAAIEAFGEAIAATEDVEDLAKLHSNRAASHLQAKNFAAAAEDAETTTSLKPTWAKGWSRLGQAKRAQGKYLEAATAFDKAAELSADAAKAAYEKDARDARTLSERASAYYSSAFSSGGGSSAAYGPAPDAFAGTTTGRLLQTLTFGARMLVLFNFAQYAVSFDAAGIARRYKTMLFALMAAWVLGTVRRVGRPQFSKVYVQRVLADPGFPRGFGAFILLVSKGSFLPLVPLVYVESAHLAGDLIERFRAYSPTLALKALALGESLTLLDGRTGAVGPSVLHNAALIEVLAGLAVIVELATPKRNPMFIVLYWQYLQVRYVLEEATPGGPKPLKAAFAKLDAQISGLLATTGVPGILRTGYAKLKDVLARQVAVPQPGQPRQPRCSIM